MNYNLLDNEKATKNIELRKKKPAYKAYDEPEYDEFGVVSIYCDASAVVQLSNITGSLLEWIIRFSPNF